MIKLIYLVSFLFATVVQINASHLDDIDLNAAQAVLTNAKSSFASKSNKGTLYQNIYTEVRKRTPLKGSDAESLFLDLYISTCFLAHQEKGQQPENLNDDLYSQMLAPLGGTPYAHLSALELTGILSRVRGIHKSNDPSNMDPFHNSFANLMTGRGRFKLKESTEEKRQQLIMDIYRYYNLNHPITGHLNNKNNFTFELLWTEITGDSFDLATHLSSGSHDIHQEHAFNCLIISYLASDSPAYRLLVDYENAPYGVFKKLKYKLGEENYRKHEQQIRGRFFYFYKVISSQIMGGQYTEFDQYIRDKSQCDQSKLKLLDGFYLSNLTNGTLDVAKINRQIQLASEGDVIPSLQNCIQSLLNNSFPYPCSRCSDFHKEEGITNAPTDEGRLAASLGALSSQATLTPYLTWVTMMDILVSKGTWDRGGKAKKVWDAVNDAVESGQPLRKSLFSFLEHKVVKNKVLYAKKVNDPSFVPQKTQKEIDEDVRKEKEEKIQLQKLPNELSGLQEHWNLFLRLEEKIKKLNGDAVSGSAFKKGITDIVAKKGYNTAYRALALKVHPDKSGNDNSPYKKQWEVIHYINVIIADKDIFS